MNFIYFTHEIYSSGGGRLTVLESGIWALETGLVDAHLNTNLNRKVLRMYWSYRQFFCQKLTEMEKNPGMKEVEPD